VSIKNFIAVFDYDFWLPSGMRVRDKAFRVQNYKKLARKEGIF